MKRRSLALLLSLCLLVGLFPAGALAADTTETTTETAATDTSGITRYTILLLDCSSSMQGTPLARMKEAATQFVQEVLQAQGTNYVALVPFSNMSSTRVSFTDDEAALTKSINGLKASGGTNMSSALDRAIEMMANVASGDNVVKNVVLLSDGLPQSGSSTKNGRYTSADSTTSYPYANICYEKAAALQETCALYTLGFFHSLSGNDLDFARTLMNDLQNAGYHEVTETDDLSFGFGAIADDVAAAGATVRHTFQYGGFLVKDRDVTDTCYYSDSYFWGDARTYNASLATMSLCFELSTWSSLETDAWTTDPTATNAPFRNAKDLLAGDGGLGFKDFDVNSFWGSAPTKDSIGAVAANKVIKKANGQSVTLVALGVRGGGYGQEWASNFTLGASGDHDGFAEARDNVLSFLKSYVTKYHITGNIKLWVVGYSRGGGVANMVAGALDDKSYTLPNVTINTSDLYAYTFEAPQGENRSSSEQMSLTSSGVYSNIHNIVNLTDVVPLVAPSAWNFWRNDRDTYLPSAATSAAYGEELSNMLNRYKTFQGDTTYVVDDYATQYSLHLDPSRILHGQPMLYTTSYLVPTSQVLVDSTTFLFQVVGSRSFYNTYLESGVRDVFSALNGGSLNPASELFQALCQQLTLEKLSEIMAPMTSPNPFLSMDARKAQVDANIAAFVSSVVAQSDLSDVAGTATLLANLDQVLATLLRQLIYSCIGDVDLSDGLSTPSLSAVRNLVSLIAEGNVGRSHYPEVTLAWMMSQDPNYDGTAKSVRVSGTRIIRINCPVDVYVYDENGTLLTSIQNDTYQTEDVSAIQAYVNGDGEKIVLLPPDGDYTVKMEATGDGQVYYSVNEYNYDAQAVVRVLNYAPVTVETGDVLTGIVPAFSLQDQAEGSADGSTTTYQLYKGTQEILGAAQATGTVPSYDVTVTAGDYGYVTGGGTYVTGSFALVTAYPMYGGSFLGWYDSTGTLVSTQETYRFPVTGDTGLTAQFTPVDTYALTLEAQTGGTVEYLPSDLPAGVQAQVVATPEEGYTFVGWTATGGTLEDSTSATTWFTMPAQGATVTARFTKDGGTTSPSGSGNNSSSDKSGTGSTDKNTSSTTENAVTLPAAVPGGSVTSSPASAAQGTKVTLTPAPEAGYALDTIAVTDGSGTALPLTDNGDGTYTFVMPASPIQVTATFTAPSTQSDQTFPDVSPDAYYSDAVQWAAANGVTTGTGSGFAPDLACTRAQMVTFLWRASGSPAPASSASPFADVDQDSYYADAVLWAVEQGITKGTSATTFAPNATVTRAQTVTFLHRAAGAPAAAGDTFSDVKAGAYYQEAVSWAVEQGITKGTSTTKFSPGQACTRAQIVTFLYRYLDLENS